MIMETGNFCL